MAIVGPSGGGKSTIIDLLSKFYIVDKGKVLVDGIDISRYNTSQLRNIIGIVTKNQYYFMTQLEIISPSEMNQLMRKKLLSLQKLLTPTSLSIALRISLIL